MAMMSTVIGAVLGPTSDRSVVVEIRKTAGRATEQGAEPVNKLVLERTASPLTLADTNVQNHAHQAAE
jgi:hypothetical protein